MCIIRANNLGISFVLHKRKTTTLTETVIRLIKRQPRSAKLSKNEKETLWALKDVTFAIKAGESVGVIGRNGAGKSTLLQVLAGIYKPDLGEVEQRGKIGLLQLGMGFHPDLTGRDNIFLNGAILGFKKKEIEAIYDSIVAFSELERFIDTPIKGYSAGMSSRLGFSIAINISPDILLIDEMLATGDARFRNKCYQKIQEIKEQGRTIIFVSHSMNEVKRLCERALCLEKGTIIREGSSDEVTDFYLNEVAGGENG